MGLTVNIASTWLVYHRYGTSSSSDVYFLSFSILSALQLIFQSLVEQFTIIFRGKLKSTAVVANPYLKNILFLMGFVGFALGLVLVFGSSYVIQLFSIGIDAGRRIELVQFSTILFGSLLFYLPFQILCAALNAIDKIGIPYLCLAFPPLAVLIVQLVPQWNIRLENLAWGYSIGSLFASGVAAFFLHRAGAFAGKFREFNSSEFFELARLSIALRSAHNIHSLFLAFAITNWTSRFPAGLASNFFYAKKFADAGITIAYGPAQKILLNNFIDSISAGNFSQVRRRLKEASFVFPIVFLALFAFVALGLTIVPYISGAPLKFDVQVVIMCLLLLSVANTLVSIEVSYAMVNQVNKRVGVIVLANVGFIILFSITLFITSPFLGIYALPLSIAIGQISNFAINRRAALALLPRK